MTKSCEKCGEGFNCGAAAGQCWCQAVPQVPNIPDIYIDCLCQKCLASFASVPGELELNKDYYLDEDKNFVFTEAYHLKRGFCCKNNCRHCPY